MKFGDIAILLLIAAGIWIIWDKTMIIQNAIGSTFWDSEKQDLKPWAKQAAEQYKQLRDTQSS